MYLVKVFKLFTFILRRRVLRFTLILFSGNPITCTIIYVTPAFQKNNSVFILIDSCNVLLDYFECMVDSPFQLVVGIVSWLMFSVGKNNALLVGVKEFWTCRAFVSGWPWAMDRRPSMGAKIAQTKTIYRSRNEYHRKTYRKFFDTDWIWNQWQHTTG